MQIFEDVTKEIHELREREIAEVWPEKCPVCGGPAYLGFQVMKCVAKDCSNYDEKEGEKYLAKISELVRYSLKEIEKAIESVPRLLTDPLDENN